MCAEKTHPRVLVVETGGWQKGGKRSGRPSQEWHKWELTWKTRKNLHVSASFIWSPKQTDYGWQGNRAFHVATRSSWWDMWQWEGFRKGGRKSWQWIGNWKQFLQMRELETKFVILCQLINCYIFNIHIFAWLHPIPTMDQLHAEIILQNE